MPLLSFLTFLLVHSLAFLSSAFLRDLVILWLFVKSRASQYSELPVNNADRGKGNNTTEAMSSDYAYLSNERR